MRLLLIEDDPEITRVVRRGLEAEGFAVDVASDGTDGLWQASEGRFDAIILDLLMPACPVTRSARNCARPATGCRSSC